MHLTPDGQITIPPEIRNQLGISSDTELEFEIENNKLYIKKKQLTDPVSVWLNTMRGCIAQSSTDEIMSLTRNDETP
jgi:AbrB family looped-hinge helix DNA binding protein